MGVFFIPNREYCDFLLDNLHLQYPCKLLTTAHALQDRERESDSLAICIKICIHKPETKITLSSSNLFEVQSRQYDNILAKTINTDSNGQCFKETVESLTLTQLIYLDYD